jgi:hypothetical protein
LACDLVCIVALYGFGVLILPHLLLHMLQAEGNTMPWGEAVLY